MRLFDWMTAWMLAGCIFGSGYYVGDYMRRQNPPPVPEYRRVVVPQNPTMFTRCDAWARREFARVCLARARSSAIKQKGEMK